MLSTASSLTSRRPAQGGGGTMSVEDKSKLMLDDILERLPDEFDMIELTEKLQVRAVSTTMYQPRLAVRNGASVSFPRSKRVTRRRLFGPRSTVAEGYPSAVCNTKPRSRRQGEERTPFTNVFLQEIERCVPRAHWPPTALSTAPWPPPSRR
jgi:hypothetical protein